MTTQFTREPATVSEGVPLWLQLRVTYGYATADELLMAEEYRTGIKRAETAGTPEDDVLDLCRHGCHDSCNQNSTGR